MIRLHNNINAEIRELLQEWEFIKKCCTSSKKYLHWANKAASLLKHTLEECGKIEYIYVLKKLEHYGDNIMFKDVAYFRSEHDADMWAEKNIHGIYKVEKVKVMHYDKP